MDLRSKSPDIALVLLYKSGGTLVVIDTGATAAFVEYLNRQPSNSSHLIGI